MECGSSDNFSSHICSIVAETIDVRNYTTSFGAKNVQKTSFEAAEIMLGPWNQQCSVQTVQTDFNMIIFCLLCHMNWYFGVIIRTSLPIRTVVKFYNQTLQLR